MTRKKQVKKVKCWAVAWNGVIQIDKQDIPYLYKTRAQALSCNHMQMATAHAVTITYTLPKPRL